MISGMLVGIFSQMQHCYLTSKDYKPSILLSITFEQLPMVPRRSEALPLPLVHDSCPLSHESILVTRSFFQVTTGRLPSFLHDM